MGCKDSIERARKELQIPHEFQLEAMAAVGTRGPKELLSGKSQTRESPNDRRKFSESIFDGPFGLNAFDLTTGRLERRTRGGRSADPT